MNYQLATSLDKNRVFILRKSELEKRFDPNTYHIERRKIIDALKKSGHKLQPLKFVSSFKKSIVKEIPTNLPYLGLENIESNTGSFIPTIEKDSISSAIEFRKGQVLFPKLRPYLNKVHFADFDGVCSTEFHVLDSTIVSNEYLANYLRTNLVVNQTKYLMSGNTLPRLQTEDIEDLLIPILLKDEENNVNALMKKAFEQKQKNETAAEKLLSSIDDYLLKELGIELPKVEENSLKNRMFKSSIKEISGGRFDPFSNSQGFKMFFESLQKCSYPFKKFREVANINTGAVIHTSDYLNEGIPLIRIQNVLSTGIAFEDVKYVSEEIFLKEPTAQIVAGELLFGMSGTIGRVAIAQENLPKCLLNQRIAKVNVTGEHNSIFIQSILNSSIGITQFKRIGTGGIQINIGIADIENLKIPIPPIKKQKEIAEHITHIRLQAQELKDQTKIALQKANEEIEEILLG